MCVWGLCECVWDVGGYVCECVSVCVWGECMCVWLWGVCEGVCGGCECVGWGVCVWVFGCVCGGVSVGVSVCVRLAAPSVPPVCPLRKPNSPRAGPFLHALAPHAGLGRGCCAW